MSHGPVDIVAARRGRIRLIQVKSGTARVTDQELKLMKVWARAFNADAEIWSFRQRGKIDTEFVFRRSTKKKAPKVKHPVPEPIQMEPLAEATSFLAPIETPSLIS
jgi:hypothetical protein